MAKHLFMACEYGHDDVVQFLLEKCDGIVIPDKIFDVEIEAILEKYR